MKDQNYETRHIPANFESGITIAGMSFNIRFLVEGGILGFLAGILTFLYLEKIATFDRATLIGVSLAIGIIFLFVGTKGINDEPITVFIYNLIIFVRNKKTSYYNPRIKIEVATPKESKEDSKRIDIASNVIANLKNKVKRRIQKNAEIRDEKLSSNEVIVFTDDIALKAQNEPKKRNRYHAEKK